MKKLFVLLFIIPLVANVFAQKITFNKDIAPIIFENCTPCHRPNQATPFSLLGYYDVVKRASMIEYMIANKYMPPWPADHTYVSFADEKVLSEEEIELISDWIRDNMPEGRKRDLPQIPQFADGSQLPLGAPDIQVSLDSVFLPGNNYEHWLFANIPIPLASDSYVKQIEFIPGNREYVHHMNADVVSYEPNKVMNDEVKTFVYEVTNSYIPNQTLNQMYDSLQLLDDNQQVPSVYRLSFFTGGASIAYPKGIGGYHVNKKASLFVNILHYGTTPIDVVDKSYFNIYLGEPIDQREEKWLPLGYNGLSEVLPKMEGIPADTLMEFRTNYTLKDTICLLSIQPHMHYIGRNFRAVAITPDAKVVKLVRINKWDFNYQNIYKYKKPIILPKGSVIMVNALFDNRSNNYHNPYEPPRFIPWGTASTDEMLQLNLFYMDYQPGDDSIDLTDIN